MSLEGSATSVPTAAASGGIFLKTNFLKKSEKVSRRADEAHPLKGMFSKNPCKCLIQPSAGFELKPLGRQTANALN